MAKRDTKSLTQKNTNQADTESETTTTKKPLYKQWWFILFVVLFVLCAIGITGQAERGHSSNTHASTTTSQQQADQTNTDKKSGTSSDTTDTNNKSDTSKDSSNAENKSDNNADSSDKKATANEPSFSKDNAFRAAVAALTNCFADDVFTADGDSFDSSKFHSYADVSGYYLTVENQGTWSAKDESWHVDGLKLHPYISQKSAINASLDVSFDGTNYQIKNVSGTYSTDGSSANETDLTTFTGGFSEPCLTVPASLASEDRNAQEEAANDHSGDLEASAAMSAVEMYGKRQYPYGFKVHWILGKIADEQNTDGSWYFKYKVTVTNEYGANMDGVVETTVGGTTASPVVQSFTVY